MKMKNLYQTLTENSGIVEKDKDPDWNGFMVRIEREKAQIAPEFFVSMNDGISFVLVYKRFEKREIQKLEVFFNKRLERVLNRVSSMGKKGIKSLFTKGSRWAIDSAFGTEEDMKVTEFSGVFSFADPTVIDYEDFEVALRMLETLSDLKMDFLHCEDHSVIALNIGGGDFTKVVAQKMKRTDYSGDEGRKAYGIIGCLANFAWARRQMLTGIMEAAVKDAFGKHVQMKKLVDISFTIAFDDGKNFIYRFNYPKTENVALFKDEKGMTLVQSSENCRMVPANE